MKRHAKLILVLLVVFGTGCQSSVQAPFHIYDSPLLNAENHPSHRKSREFDPFESMGDHVQAAPAYATNTTPEPVVPAPSVEPPTGKTPTLSISGAVGGHKDTTSHATAANTPGSYESQYAAAYAVTALEVNGVKFSPAASASIPQLYKECKKAGKVNHAGKPLIGDLVFFHNVQDSNADGRNNDWYGHVGIVENVLEDGTVELLGWSNGKLERKSVNLAKPESTTEGAHVYNSQLRSPGGKDAPFTQYFASELFAGYCSVLGDKKQFVAVENWQPQR